MWATAFGGHGMNTTAMGGIADERGAILAPKDRRGTAALLLHDHAVDWAGGPFGRVGAVQAGYWLTCMA